MQSALVRREHSAYGERVQVAYAHSMGSQTPRQIRRAARLKTLIEEVGGFTRAEADTGTPRSHLSAIVAGRRGLGDALAAKIERRYKKPAGWFDQADDGWPFRNISVERYLALTPEDRIWVESKLDSAIAEREELAREEATSKRLGETPPIAGHQPSATKGPPGWFPGEVDIRAGRVEENRGAVNQSRRVPAKRGRRGA